MFDLVAILIEESVNTGHWLGLSKYNGIYELYDPYGGKLGATMSWIDITQRRNSNELVPYLSILLRNENLYI